MFTAPDEYRSEDEILIEQSGPIVVFTLNRPKALNALSLDMLATLSTELTQCAEDDNVKAVVFQGAGDRAFCAGGDIKHIYQRGRSYKKENSVWENPAFYFHAEYNLNKQLYHYPKPLIALMDGITMGGGFGIAGPCDFRIATERLKFAMPEVGIGFFPDVGSVHYLQKCPHYIGAYLCFTGQTINCADALYSGVVTHAVSHKDLESLLKTLSEGTVDKGFIEKTLDEYKLTPKEKGMLEAQQDIIQECFGHDNVEGMLRSLKKYDDDFANETRMTIEKRSPLSVKITQAHFNQSKDEKFDDVIARDFTLVQHFLEEPDFYEGIRAAVVDKDGKPRWRHQDLSAVKPDEVDAFFKDHDLKLEDRL